MKNMNDKTKKWLTIAGLGIICVALVVVIGSRFITEPPVDDPLPTSDVALDDVNPSPNSGDGQKAGENEMAVKPNPQTPEPDDTGAPAVSSGTEQTIQGDVVKPKEPTEAEKTDPSQTPDGEKVSDPQPVDHDNVPPPTSSSEPQGGEKKDGKIYVPGFGWIEDNGGGGSGTTADDMYENGNKIGEMN